VKVLPRYAALPFSLPIIFASLVVLMMVVWSQGGFNSAVAHLFFLIASYTTWGFMLPFIQGLTVETKGYHLKALLPIVLRAALLILIHFFLSNALYYLFQFLFFTEFIPPTFDTLRTIIGPSLVSRSIDFILFFGLLSWVNQSRALAEKNIRLMSAEAQLQKSRFASLKSQLNPHFLFNTRRAISSLIVTDDEKARSITMKISTLLRKTLQANEERMQPLQKELELAEEYLDIELERFNDRLTIHKELDPDAYDVELPTMTLQPLLENAIKHGVSLVEGATTLILLVKKEDYVVAISVINDVSPKRKSTTPSAGIGLANLEERLRLQYGEEFELTYGIRQQQFQVALRIPYHEL